MRRREFWTSGYNVTHNAQGTMYKGSWKSIQGTKPVFVIVVGGSAHASSAGSGVGVMRILVFTKACWETDRQRLIG